MEKLEIISFSQISKQDWTSFHQSCNDPVLFYQYPFLSAYTETTQENIDVVIFKENGKLLIALPGRFDEKKKTFFNLTYLGWDNLNFLISKEVKENTVESFFSELSKVFDLVVYKNISRICHQTIFKNTVGAKSFKGFRCPFIHLPNLYQTYLDTIGASTKKSINRYTNLCRRSGIEFRLILSTSKESLKDAFSELNRLHKMRMDEVNLKSKFLKPESQKFHQILRSYAIHEFILIVQAVDNEKVIGSIYGFVSSNRYAYFASGIDPDYSKFNLGTVMIGKLIEYLISNNYKYFDFLRGTEEYKFRWTKETNQNYTVYGFTNILGRFKAIQLYWKENKKRLGRKQTLANLKRFLWK